MDHTAGDGVESGRAIPMSLHLIPPGGNGGRTSESRTDYRERRRRHAAGQSPAFPARRPRNGIAGRERRYSPRTRMVAAWGSEAPTGGAKNKIELRRLAVGGDEVRPVQKLDRLLQL